MSSYIDEKTERVFNKVNTFMDNAPIEELVNYVKQVFKLDFTYSIKKVDYLHKRELTSEDILDSCDLGLVNYMFTELYISIRIYAQLFVNGNKTPLGEYYLQNLTDEDINNAKIGLFGDVSFTAGCCASNDGDYVTSDGALLFFEYSEDKGWEYKLANKRT